MAGFGIRLRQAPEPRPRILGTRTRCERFRRTADKLGWLGSPRLRAGVRSGESRRAPDARRTRPPVERLAQRSPDEVGILARGRPSAKPMETGCGQRLDRRRYRVGGLAGAEAGWVIALTRPLYMPARPSSFVSEVAGADGPTPSVPGC